MKETLSQLIIRDLLAETSGEIDLSQYEHLLDESIKYYLMERDKKIIGIIEKIPTENPQYESDMYDKGRKDFKEDLIKNL